MTGPAEQFGGWGPVQDAPGHGRPPGYGQPPSPTASPGQEPSYGPPAGYPPPYGPPPYGQPYQQNGQPGQAPTYPAGGYGYGGPAGGWAAVAPRPGIIPLRPLGLGEIYDGAFRAIRTNPKTMLGVSAIVIAATSLITALPQAAALTNFGSSSLFDPNQAQNLDASDVFGPLSGLLSSLLIPAILQGLAVTIVSGLLIIAVSGAVLGRKTPPAELWARTRKRIPGLIGVALAVPVAGFLIAVVPVGLGILLVVAHAPVIGVILVVLGVLASVVGYVGLNYAWWALAAPALLLEEMTVRAALVRSYRLVKGSFWRVLGISLLTALLVSILGGVISVPFSIGGTLLTIGRDNPYDNYGLTLAQLAIQDIGTILSGAVLYPFTAAVAALLYIDLRMRREGLDVQLMASVQQG